MRELVAVRRHAGQSGGDTVGSASAAAHRAARIAGWYAIVALCALCLSVPSAADAAPGDLDSAFSGDGLQTTNFGGGGIDFAEDVVRLSNGSVLAVGASTDDFALARYLSDGSLDPSFSGDGKQTTSFDGAFGSARAGALQTNGRLVVVGSMCFGVNKQQNCDFAVARYLPDGSLDPSFSGDGKQTTDFGGGGSAFDDAKGVAIEADGDIVVVGEASSGAALARYAPDGTLDPTFSGDGKQTTPETPAGGQAGARDVVIQADGKIVAVGSGGSVFDTQGTDFWWARYDDSGALDPSFSGDGTASLDLGGQYEAGESVVLQNGKIAVLGGTSTGGESDFALVRLTSSGSPDPSFSTDGSEIVDFAGGFDEAGQLAVGTNDTLVSVGRSEADFAVARVLSNGGPDTTFSGDGLLTTDVATKFDRGSAVALEPNDGITAVGSAGGDGDFGLVRYTATGSLDSTFSGDGKVTTDFDGPDRAADVALTTTGGIVTAGKVQGSQVGVAVYASNGTLDPSFSGDGKLTATGFGGVSAVAVQPADGKILITGYADTVSGFALARFNSDGTPDTSFSGDGLQQTAIPGGGNAREVAIQSNGKIVVAGLAGGQYATARYDENGTLDPSYSGDGIATASVGGFFASAEGVAIQPDGKIIAVGSNGDAWVLTRFTSGGALDPDFSSDGIQTTSLGYGLSSGARSVVVQPDDKLVVAGSAGLGDIGLARYTSDGTPDPTFSGDGQKQLGLGAGTGASDLVMQSDGKLVAAGTSESGDFEVVRLNPSGGFDASFSGDGKVKSEFGNNDFREGADALVLQGDGKIVVAGGADGGDSTDFAVARYEGGGPPPPSDATPPDTSIMNGPGEGSVITTASATFTLASTEPDSTFECHVDGTSFLPCTSPIVLNDLVDGSHTFEVVASDAAGNTDSTPSARTFTVHLPGPPPADSDGDGVPDGSDSCPSTPAATANGCPVSDVPPAGGGSTGQAPSPGPTTGQAAGPPPAPSVKPLSASAARSSVVAALARKFRKRWSKGSAKRVSCRPAGTTAKCTVSFRYRGRTYRGTATVTRSKTTLSVKLKRK